jgi:hypothetical protein
MKNEELQSILKRGGVTSSNIPKILAEIGKLGHTAILNVDGERQKDIFSMSISFPDNPQQILRRDFGDLETGVSDVLNEYLKKIDDFCD